MESIHAIVNTLARRYAALDIGRRATQILRSLGARKQRKDVDLKAKAEKGEEHFHKKRSRKQGRASNEPPVAAEPNQDIVDAANQFLDLVQKAADGEIDDFWGDNGPAFPSFQLVDCPECRNAMQEDDVQVPDILLRLHSLLCHTDIGEKFDG